MSNEVMIQQTMTERPTMTSIELLSRINTAREDECVDPTQLKVKRHDQLLAKIRKRLSVEESLGGVPNIWESSYINEQHKTLPMYILSLSTAKMMVADESVTVSVIVGNYISYLETQPMIMTDVEKFQTMLDQAKQIETLQIEHTNSERAHNQGYKAQFNKKQKQVSTIQSVVGVTRQKDIIPTIEILKRENTQLHKSDTQIDEILHRNTFLEDKIDLLKKKAERYDTLKANHDKKKLKQKVIKEEIDEKSHEQYFTVTELAKTIEGMSAVKLNNILLRAGMQYKERLPSGNVWYVSEKGVPYADTKTSVIDRKGITFSKSILVWKQDVLNYISF